MSLLFVNCPKTLLPISTGIETTSESLRRVWDSNFNVSCPHCAEKHTFKVREAYTTGAISDAVFSNDTLLVPRKQRHL